VYIALAIKNAKLATANTSFIVIRFSSILSLNNKATNKQIHPNANTINVPLLMINNFYN
jgi:hypothetical protein